MKCNVIPSYAVARVVNQPIQLSFIERMVDALRTMLCMRWKRGG